MKTKPLMLTLTSAAVLFCALGNLPVLAQPAIPPLAPVYQPLSDQQLDQLLGPIALYPDPLLGEILPAATFPTQIVLADRYLVSGGDPNSIDQQPWDASVLALAHYPTVLKYMDDNLAWTTVLGQAFLNQQQQVMESIQRLRLSAENFGNLQSTPQQQVVNDDGCVEILPTQPDVVYVPVYQPQYIYCQSGFSLGFGFGCALGPWLSCDFDWVHHDLRHWDHNHHRPANWWHERPDQRQAAIASQTSTWHPENHHGFVMPNHNDRGWNNQGGNHTASAPVPASTAAQNQTTQWRDRPQQGQQQLQQRSPQLPQHNANDVGQQRPSLVGRPQPNSSFVSPETSHEIRTFSDRGQQSVGTFTHNEPVQTQSAPAQIHIESPQPHFEAPAPAPAPRSAPAPAPVSQGGGNGGGGGEASHGGSRR